MVAGSLGWVGVIGLFALGVVVFSYAVIRRINWLEKDVFKLNEIIERGYVGESCEEEGIFAEVGKRFIKNIWLPFLIYLLAVLIMEFVPGLGGIIFILVGLFVFINVAFLGFTVVLTRQLEIDIGEFWFSILPHGIFEYLGIFAILAHSLWLVSSKARISPLGSLQYVGIATLLIFLAAVIEICFTRELIRSRAAE